jgi:CrcB protein
MNVTGGALGLIAVGGFFGAAAREAVEQWIPTSRGAFPVATLLVNLAGAFLLGVLLATLVRTGDDRASRQRIRLLAGTGFLGAFTTYSTFAVESDLLIHDGHAATALVYVVISVVAGLASCTAGLLVSARWGRPSMSLPLDPDTDAEEDSP